MAEAQLEKAAQANRERTPFLFDYQNRMYRALTINAPADILKPDKGKIKLGD